MRYDALYRIARRMRVDERIPHFAYFAFDGFDRAVARRLEAADVVVGWSGMALHTHRRARSLGARAVLERGSSHIVYQRDVLDDEYRRWGLPSQPLFDAWGIEKELREYEEADAIAIASDFVRRSFVAKGVPEAKLVQAPYGVDLRAFRPGNKATPGFRAIYAGALTLRKGIPDLLEAARLASVELRLVGARSPEVEPFLRKYAANHRWLGAVPQSELPACYGDAEVFAIASLEDGFAMVVPQALACGLPVICSENTGASDLIEDGVNGFVVPIRDPEAIAARLCQLRDDPVRLQEMQRAAVASVASGGSWSDYGRIMAGHYRRLVAGDAPAPSTRV
jgi:glycosyltransferase involved in cell wall biosynthesis